MMTITNLQEFIEFWKSLSDEPVDMHEVYTVFFNQETYLEGEYVTCSR